LTRDVPHGDPVVGYSGFGVSVWTIIAMRHEPHTVNRSKSVAENPKSQSTKQARLRASWESGRRQPRTCSREMAISSQLDSSGPRNTPVHLGAGNKSGARDDYITEGRKLVDLEKRGNRGDVYPERRIPSNIRYPRTSDAINLVPSSSSLLLSD
jgi:hypothetical protein